MKRVYSHIFLLATVSFFFSISNSHAEILISNLDNIEVSTSAILSRDLVITERVCIASNPVTTYALIAFGSGEGGLFSIQNGPFSIQYSLSYRDRRSGPGFRELSPSVPLSGFLTRPLGNNQNCRGNAGRVRITISKTSLNSAVAGIYQGSISLVVSPE